MNFKIPSWSDTQQWQTAIVVIGSLHWAWDTFRCSVITYSVAKRKPLAPPQCATNTKSVWEKTGNIKNPPAPKLPTSVETGLRPFWSFKVLKGNGKAAHKLHTSQAEMRDRVPPKNKQKYGNTKSLIKKSKLAAHKLHTSSWNAWAPPKSCRRTFPTDFSELQMEVQATGSGWYECKSWCCILSQFLGETDFLVGGAQER